MKQEAVQLERDRYSTNQNTPSIVADNSIRPRSFSNSAAQTNLTFKDFLANELTDEPVRPTPCRIDANGLVPLSQSADSMAVLEEIALIEELVQLEHQIWDLRDTTNILTELQPFGQLNVKFELAFLHPELVSRRYSVKLCFEKTLFCFR